MSFHGNNTEENIKQWLTWIDPQWINSAQAALDRMLCLVELLWLNEINLQHMTLSEELDWNDVYTLKLPNWLKKLYCIVSELSLNLPNTHPTNRLNTNVYV